ncbi:MAG: rod shape-determining protein RodA [Minisyncoccia bacterium]
MKLFILDKIDRTLLLAVAILTLIGLVAIFSTSFNSAGTGVLNFEKQLAFTVAGIIIMLFFSFFDYRALKNYTGILYVFCCVILVSVLFFGASVRGTASWFDLGAFNFQPSEFIKIIIIIILAKYFSRFGLQSNNLKKTIVSGIYVLVPVFMVALQPDLGSSLIIAFTWIAMLLISGIKKSHFLFIIFMAVIISGISWNFVLKDYQKDRVRTFFNSQQDLKGAGYNVNQSIIAIGSGNIWGKGLGHGSQSQLNFLPEKHTDFIFAVIAEEMGFIGVLLVLGLFGIIFYRLLKIAEETQDNFGKFLVLGTSVLLFFHVIINIGMNMGIMPVTGIPLPFVSYGGSSMISLMIMAGIVQSVYKRGRGYKFGKEEDEV